MILKTALWHANSKRCFYCEEPVAFRDLEIDHLIPESVEAERLSDLTLSLKLDSSFRLDSPRNMVPTHHNCNARKSDTIFSVHNLRYYMQIWQAKQVSIEKELYRLSKDAENDKILISIASKIQKKELTLQEVVAFLKTNIAGPSDPPLEPVVVTFSINLIEMDIAPSPQKYDELEKDLRIRIKKSIPSTSSMTEPSLRNGECLSVRIAFWALDLNRLQTLNIPGWDILEIAQYSALYPWTWEDIFPNGKVTEPDEAH